MAKLIREKLVLFGFVLLSLVMAGFLFFVSVHSYESSTVAPPAINYAPNLWFDSEEKYYPVNIWDSYFENGIEIEGEKAVNKYNKLSLKDKLNNLTVFYHIDNEGNQWVYQYWFFYVFNDYKKGIRNKHYGDWESVFVFVDKDSKEVIKVIGTAHQRKLFNTEIYDPKSNHIWSYIGGGSHANCVDNNGEDGECNRTRWRRIEKWDKRGSKVSFKEYTLVEFTLSFINKFKGAVTLEKSGSLGIELPNILKKITGKNYLPVGSDVPILAWNQSNYYDSEKLVPIGWRYVSDKVSQTKDRTIAFVSGLITEVSAFFKNDQQEQGAGIVNIIEVRPQQRSDLVTEPIPPANLPISNPVEEIIEVEKQNSSAAPQNDNIINISPATIEISEPVEITELVEEIEPKESQSIAKLTPPMGFPFFIGGAGAPLVEEIPEPEPEPEPDTTPPAAITDLSASSGDDRGTIDLSWTSPGADQYIIKYATSSEITSLNWALSTDIVGELAPSSASITESFSVGGLNINEVYYWAIKSIDEAGNISDLSNVDSATPSALADYVIINEVQLGSNEFIELYNPTDQAIDMTDWYWSYFPYNYNWNNPYRNKSFSEALNSPIIPAQGYYLIGLSGYPESNGYVDADWQVYVSDQLSGIKDSIAIFSANPATTTPELAKEGLIDAIGWGAVDYVIEGNSALAAISNKTLTRKINGWDTNDNSNDFIESNWPTPQNSQGDKAAIIGDNFSFTQDTTWTLSDNVYILISNSNAYPIVESGAVLTIEPGVIIKGANKYYSSLVVKGALKAQGTSANPIVFTATTSTPQTGDWSGIVFDNANNGSILEYVNFEYGGYQVSYGGDNQIKEMIRIDNTQVIISNSTFEYSQNNGIYLDNSNSFISNSNFENNTSTGIIINSGSPSISDCEFENNDIGIEIINQASPIVNNNTFSNNNYPIEIKSSYPVLSSNQALDNNLNGIIVHQDSVFSQNATWNNDLPYILFSGSNDYPTVASGTVLTLESDIVIKPYNKYYTALLIEGSLIAQGATSTPIVFTSLKDDDYGGDANNDSSDTIPEVGDWKNIKFIAGSSGELEHILFRYGSASVLDINGGANVNQNNIVYEP